ncbi:alkane hydroxylase MAH1-like [Ziziphus jujuba]|uniref:Alkane hydroxylase MAH1-like n=1 Tax=Ziziphus jujuba TaxID=326968 RepID=A0A6P3YVF1_ZIZJJ|nr:alkane hydroxylase MAH1-like [Ziziphus jujuba]
MACVIGYVELLVAVVCFVLLRHWRVHRNTSVIITNWPLVGMLPGLLRNVSCIHDFASHLLQKGGGTVEIKGPWLANLDFLVTSDPMNVQHILNKSFANYPKGPEFKMIFEPLGDGIFNSDSDLWKFQRKMFQLLMAKSKFELYMEKTIHRNVVDGLIPLLHHVSTTEIQVDLQEVFQRLTFDNICLLVLGFDPHCLSIEFPEVAYEKAFDNIERIVLLRHVQPQSWWKLQKWLQIGGEKQLAESLKVFDEFLHQCISKKQHEYNRIDQKDESNFDMLTIYMAEQQKQGQREYLGMSSDKFLRDTALNFLVAGRDTIGSALTWFFWLVSTHPFVETKLVEEINEKLTPKHDDKAKVFGAGEVSKLVYLHAALYESLRLYPPIPINHKAASQSDTLPSGHHIKQNQRILISFYSMGRMEEIWGKDCLEFKPERWISDKGEIIYVPSYKFTAFNNGPRSCLGKNMTFLQMKMVATAMLWNFRFQVVKGHPISPDMSVILYMKHGLKVIVSNRFCGA